MNKYGYIRISAGVPKVAIANPYQNARNINSIIRQASKEGSRLVLFPELSVTGYTCGDLFNQELLLNDTIQALSSIVDETARYEIAAVVGIPLRCRGRLYNCAVAIDHGVILGVVPKTYIPNYNEFYEKRWFASGALTPATKVTICGQETYMSTRQVFTISGVRVGIEICEDLWTPNPPSGNLCTAIGADIILNLSASDELTGKHAYLRSLVLQQSARCRCGYVYASAGVGESSTDLAFCGNLMIAEDGVMLAEGKRFSLEAQMVTSDIDVEKLRADRRHFNSFGDNQRILTDVEEEDSARIVSEYIYSRYYNPNIENTPSHQEHERMKHKEDNHLLRHVNPYPFVPQDEDKLSQHCEEITSIQAWGLIQRLSTIGCKNAVIGISGGLDSTLALMVTVKAFDALNIPRKNITAITMPGFGTTGRTHSNASTLMELLGVTSIEIPINEAVNLHFQQIGHDPAVHDATYENSQARQRTLLLMDMANKTGGIVIGTGDLSELALGWCTYNGDHMSMYAVNSSVPKTLVKYLVGYYAKSESKEIADVLHDIIDTPISPELIPANDDDTIAQKTEDLVGPYDLHDFFLYNMIRNGFTPQKILYLAQIAFHSRFSYSEIRKWLITFYRRFFSQQFKRSCMPDGPKVGSICLSPRGDWRMPSDACVKAWIDSLE